MRTFWTVGVVLCLAAAGAAGHASPGAADAGAILAAAREALGGDSKLSEVKSFVATGRTRQVRGNSLVPIEFELYCELPDRYVRKDEIPAQESEPTSSGFNGDRLIQIPPPAVPAAPGTRPGGAPMPAGASAGSAAPAGRAPAGQAPAGQASGGATPAGPAPAGQASGAAAQVPARAAGPPPDPRKARVTTLKQDFAKLTLGLFAASFPSYPLTFSLIGQAEAPQGRADVIEARGPDAFVLKLFVNSETHLPIMVSWTVPATNVVLTSPGKPAPANLAPGTIVVEAPAPPEASAPKEEQERYAKELMALRGKSLAGRLVEHRLYYADYRDIGNGLKFPFRLRRAIAGETTEETNFDGFTINKRIDPKRFDALK